MATATAHRSTVTPHRTVKDRMPPTCRLHPAARQAGCPACRARDAWYNRQRRRQLSAGTWQPLTPTGPVAAHIESLLTAGWTLRQIAEKAGVDQGAISDIRRGRRARGVTALMAATLLGVTGPAPEGWTVPSVGTRRRLRALGAIGYTRPHLARLLGVSTWVINQWLESERVLTTTRDRVKAVFDEYCLIPGPSEAARRRAKYFGSPPPLAWDDIDDPNEQPNLGDTKRSDDYDETTVGQACEGRLTYAQIAMHRPDLIETVRRLAKTLTDAEIGHLLRWPGANDQRTARSPSRATNSITKVRLDNGIPACSRPPSIAPRIRTGTRRTTQAA
ncbi:helix-turn-helix domain-containing protein [Micromonospora chokoriensis]|uniref:helix-turn-helix domain-containing protein n=1 Tax=Micromonospora chokoriensis TaxID=356851 RepID=UPI0004C44B1B|nr:helix-turn-helix domain-containing protein [Micromonospora chokoriensis]